MVFLCAAHENRMILSSFGGDEHLGHANIIRLSHRPFNDVDTMDKVLINNWNSVVTDDDDVYILGDLIFKTTKGYDYYLKQLNCYKNH